MNNLQLGILPVKQRELLELLSVQPFINDYYLAGGTCLALRIGHRQSIDFDFFTTSDFEPSFIVNNLNQLGHYIRGNEDRNTVNGSLNDIRISFFGYPYAIIDTFSRYNNLRLAGMKDIAAMKLEAVAGRGSRKDFADIYYLLKEYTLDEIFSFHSAKYGTGLANQYHHLKSLVYFVDAESEAMPLMLLPDTWDQIKRELVTKAKQFHF